MIQKAVVRKIIDLTHAEIEVQRQGACSGACASCAGCGATQERIQAIAINTVDAKVGDIVTIQGESGQIMRMAGVVYTLPLVLFFAFFIVASLAGLSEAAASGLGCLGIVTGILFAVYYNKRASRRNQSPFTIIKRIETC